MVDPIVQGKTRTRRQFCAYYTESDPILTYMVGKLDVKDNDLILEPCAGEGVFIDKIISLNRRVKIEAIDLNSEAVAMLREKYKDERIDIRQADTLLDSTLDLFSSVGFYTKVIGNPPYGAWQEYDKRDLLKKLYGGYVRETYALFLRKCLDLLKDNGKLVFIIPDTFLALHLHKGLRKKILENTKVEEILLMPSKFFPGVNFGYSNLCIITLLKTKDIGDHRIKVVSIKDSVDDLYKIADGKYNIAHRFESLPQKQVLESGDFSFLIGGDAKTRNLINDSGVKLGDIADCVTGFYSGDNKQFLTYLGENVQGSSNYPKADPAIIDFDFLKKNDLLGGLKNGKSYIPFLKNGKGVFAKDSDWFIKWDKKTVDFFKSNKATRFQNSQYYFKEGIGVPMVKSSQIRAFLLGKRLFDQSIVGIFPRDDRYSNYLLAFLNSEACSKIIKVINHTANNSANYLKKLPIISNEKILKRTDEIMDAYWKDKNQNLAINRINDLFNQIYKA